MTDYGRAVEYLETRLTGSDRRIAPVDLSDAALETQLRSFEGFLRESEWLDPGIPIIHVAGSKGKGSTVAMASSVLRAGGFRVGTFTSPHLHSWTERIAINNQPVAEHEFARLVNTVSAAEAAFEQRGDGRSLNLFEFLTAMAIAHFGASDCDVLIFEVGLGGRFDPTNVLIPAVSVITRLELEHVAILGPTMKEIAWNKAGIIKPGVSAVTCKQQPLPLAEIIAAAQLVDAPLFRENQEWSTDGRSSDFTYTDRLERIEHLVVGLPGPHQVQNAGMAIAAIHLLWDSGINVSEVAIRDGLNSVSLPGRFERVNHNGREIILDAAHTPESADGLAATLAEVDIHSADFVVGLLKDKDAQSFLRSLRFQISSLSLAKLAHPRSADLDQLEQAAKAADIDYFRSDSVSDALATFLNDGNSARPIVVTGSLGAVSEARVALNLDRS